MVSSTATMSARGTITSLTFSSPKFSRLASITRSCCGQSAETGVRFPRSPLRGFRAWRRWTRSSPRRICSRRLISGRAGCGRRHVAHHAATAIGIGNAQSARIFISSGSITFASSGAFMIIAQQMQHAMDHQMAGMVGESACPPLRLPARSRHRRWRYRPDSLRHSARRKGQDVGRLVLAAEIAVQSAAASRRWSAASSGALLPLKPDARSAAPAARRRRAVRPARPAPVRIVDQQRNGAVIGGSSRFGQYRRGRCG